MYCTELAGIDTGAALDAELLINFMRLFTYTPNGIRGTYLFAHAASCTVFLNAGKTEQIFTHQCRALLVLNVHRIFIAKMPDGA